MRKENIFETTVIRRLGVTDNHSKVANLIYNTDKYIFPYLFGGDIKLGEQVLEKMISLDTIYNYRFINVAECGGEILGIIIYMPTPVRIDNHEMMRAFLDSGAVIDEKYKRVFEEYYKPLENEPPDIYIANICVDSRYRGIGIASKMLSATLHDDKTYHLETVKDNEQAFKLYTRMGFEVDCEYPGFTDVPCYRMTRKSKNTIPKNLGGK